MEWLSANRLRYLSLAAVVLIWAQAAYLSLANQAFVQEIARSFPSLATYVSVHGLVVALVIVGLLWVSRETLGDIGFTSRQLGRQLGIGTLFGFGLFILHQALISPVIDALLPASAAQGVDLSLLFDNVYQYPIWIFLAVFKGGLVEEGARVFGLTRFEKVLGRPGLLIAAVVGSIVFGIGHLYQGLDSAIGTGIQALLFILIYLRKRQTLEPIVAHAVYDIIGITIAYLIYWRHPRSIQKTPSSVRLEKLSHLFQVGRRQSRRWHVAVLENSLAEQLPSPAKPVYELDPGFGRNGRGVVDCLAGPVAFRASCERRWNRDLRREVIELRTLLRRPLTSGPSTDRRLTGLLSEVDLHLDVRKQRLTFPVMILVLR